MVDILQIPLTNNEDDLDSILDSEVSDSKMGAIKEEDSNISSTGQINAQPCEQTEVNFN
jgi:hypothetical protein